MKRILLLSVVSLMAVCMMAVEETPGSSKANAIEFDLNSGVAIGQGLDKFGNPQTLWYHVDLAPLYEEDNPSLTLYLTNPNRDRSVYVKMEATVAKQTETKDYTIAAYKYKTYTKNASLLVSMKQTEIYLQLYATDSIMLSARVFETADLDETCTAARTLNLNEEATQTAGYAAWWKIDLTNLKKDDQKNVRISITNEGNGELDLVAGQSLDCPSSGLTKRNFHLAAHETMYDTIPQSMIAGVRQDELYFNLENLAQPIRIKVEQIARPADPDIEITPTTPLQHLSFPDTAELAAGTYLFYLLKSEMNALTKYEPEFTYSNTLNNAAAQTAHVNVKMAFHLPSYGSSTTDYEIAPGDEAVEVYKKNMLVGLGEDVDTVYFLMNVSEKVNFLRRFKHVREGKACKTNIPFGPLEEDNVHYQDARTTQWYSVDIATPALDKEDITVYLKNEGTTSATVKGSLAFDCPYIDLQEITRSIAPGATLHRTLNYSTYAALLNAEGLVWFGLETNQNIKFWAKTTPTETKAPDTACEAAEVFNWDEGVKMQAGETRWFLVDMKEARAQAAKIPTAFVQNLSDAKAEITAELILECPDIYVDHDKRTLKLDAYGSYSKRLSTTMFDNMKDTVYVKVTSNQEVALQIRMTEQEPGTLCSSSIPFNWTSGNDVAAGSNQWVSVDLRNLMTDPNKPGVTIHIKNKDRETCRGTAWLAFECDKNTTPNVSTVDFTLGASGTTNAQKDKHFQYSTFKTAPDSIIWVRVVANTSVHVWATIDDPQPYDPTKEISCEDIELANPDTVHWNDTIARADGGDYWFVVPKTVLDELATATVTPELYVQDLSGTTNKMSAKADYACPMYEPDMLGTSQTFSANETKMRLIDDAIMKAVTKQQQVYVHVKAQGAFRFWTKLVDPNNGSSSNRAVRVMPKDTVYQQGANDTIWYLIDTRVWKQDQSLHGKSIHIDTKNLGGDATVKVWVYEDASEQDLIEVFTGEKDKGHKSIGAGKHVSRSFPAYAVYGAADTQIRVKVVSTQPMQLSVKFSDYAPLATPVVVKDTATLAVPNVEYTIPANEEAWYAICVPYIRNNYTYTDAGCYIDLYNPGTADAKVKVITTWQDTLTFQVPERSRTLKGGAHYRKSLKQLIDKAFQKAKVNFSVESTAESFIDEQLRKYLTSDSITAYFRILTDQPLKVYIGAPQVTGADCVNSPMPFDWEHGNVNPAGETTYYLVDLEPWRVPDDAAIRLHVENWSENENNASAILRKNCTDALPLVDPINYTLTGNQDKWKDINREVIGTLGWMKIGIEYYSSETSRIWVEIVPAQPRDTVYGDTLILACVGDTVYDTFATPRPSRIPHVVDQAYLGADTLIWRDTVEFLNDTALAMWDSIFTYKVITRRNPEVIKVTNAQRPVVKRGQAIEFSATTNWLKNEFSLARNDNDTIKDVDSILWEWSTGGGIFTPLPVGTVTNTEAIKLTYQFRTLCNDTLPGDTLQYIARDTLTRAECDEFTWEPQPGTTRYYDASKLDSFVFADLDSIAYLDLTIKKSSTSEEYQTACDSYTWNGQNYTSSGDYEFKTTNAVGCDSVATLHLTINLSTSGEEYQTACESYTWNGQDYTASGDYTFNTTNAAGCDSVATLHLTINQPTSSEEWQEACESYTWNGNDYTASGDYTFNTTNVAGCDSVATLHLTINHATEGDTTATACGSFTWYGTEYTQSSSPTNVYTHTLPGANVNGCDSIVTLNLTINSAVEYSFSESACKSYKWNDETYTQTGVYQQTFPLATGCDSVVTLNLTIYSDYELKDTTNMTACKSYKWDLNDKTYTKSGIYSDTIDSKTGMYCGTVYFLNLKISDPKSVDLYDTVCGTYVWHGETFEPDTIPYDTIAIYRTELESGCDSITTLNLHVLPLIKPTMLNETACDSFTWEVTQETYTRDTIVSHTFQAGYCDSVVTLYLTVLYPIMGDTAANECNMFTWRDVLYTNDTIVYDTIAGAASNGCDSIVKLDLKINKPFVGELDLIHKNGDRLLMINRNQINKLLADSLSRTDDTTLVKWYREAEPEDEFLGYGYYYTNDGNPVPAGVYYAVVEIPASDGSQCGAKGETQHYAVSAKAGLPALIPTYALPGQDIRVINLDPELHTTIRIYTTEGVLQGTYTTNGETTYTIKAANDHGFYLVELSGDSMNTTLRYIVK